MFAVLKKCFEINLNDYENININLEINKVILGAFFALIIGVVILSIYRGSIRTVIVQLTRHGAKNEETAKKLSELGLDKSHSVKSLLCRDNILTRVVARVGEKKYNYEEYMALDKAERKKSEEVDFSSAAFYINEDQTQRAANISEKYVTSVMRTVAFCSFVAIICVCLIATMPEILNVIDNLLERTKM